MRRVRAESGFTVIEMLIALIVLAIVLALSMPVLVNVLQQGAQQSSSSAARSTAASGMALLESDLRAMRGPARGISDDVSYLNIIDQLNVTGTTSAMGNPPAYGVHPTHDIIFASPTMLEFWADVMDVGTSGPDQRAELVRWYLINDSMAPTTCGERSTWCVVRDVRYGIGPQERVSSEIIAQGQGAFPQDRSCYAGAPARPALFCYKSRLPQANASTAPNYSWAGWTTRCVDSWGYDVGYAPKARPTPAAKRKPSRGGSQQGAWIGDGVWIPVQHEMAGPYSKTRIHPLDRVTTVGIALPTAARIGSGDSVNLNVGQVELRSRRSSEYQTAIMCGAR